MKAPSSEISFVPSIKKSDNLYQKKSLLMILLLIYKGHTWVSFVHSSSKIRYGISYHFHNTFHAVSKRTNKNKVKLLVMRVILIFSGEFYLGYSKYNLEGTSWYNLVHPDYIKEVQIKHRLGKKKSCKLILDAKSKLFYSDSIRNWKVLHFTNTSPTSGWRLDLDSYSDSSQGEFGHISITYDCLYKSSFKVRILFLAKIFLFLIGQDLFFYCDNNSMKPGQVQIFPPKAIRQKAVCKFFFTLLQSFSSKMRKNDGRPSGAFFIL